MNYLVLILLFLGLNLQVYSQQNTVQQNVWDWLKENDYKYHVDTINSNLYHVNYTEKSKLNYTQIIVYKNVKTNWSRLNNSLFFADSELKTNVLNARKNKGKAIINMNGDTVLIVPFNHNYDVLSALGNNYFVFRKFDSAANNRLTYVYNNYGKLLPLPEDQEYKIFSDSFFIAISNKLNDNNRNNVGLYHLDGRSFIPVKYERIQLLSKGYYCCRSNEILKQTTKSENAKVDLDIPVPSEPREHTSYFSDLTADFCLIDPQGRIVPNSQKTIQEKFDYLRTVEEEHQKYLDWVANTLNLDLKIQYPKTQSHY